MTREVNIEQFINLVLKRKITSNEKVSIHSDELLRLLQEKIELEKKVEQMEEETLLSNDEKDVQIRKLTFEKENLQNSYIEANEKVKQLSEMELIQRNRARALEVQMKNMEPKSAYTVRYA